MAPLTYITNRSLACLLAGLWSMAASPAYAYWTVIPDDLYPTATVDARRQLAREQTTEELVYTIPFIKDNSYFNSSTKSALSNVIKKTNGNTLIRIAARPDSGVASGPMQGIPKKRAINIRNYLVKNGFSASNITIDFNNTSNPQNTEADYSCNIYILSQDVPQHPSPSFGSGQSPPPAQLTQNFVPETSLFEQYVAESVHAGRISPEMAAQLLTISQQTSVAQTRTEKINENKRPAVTASVTPDIITPTKPLPASWEILETDLTLQKTLSRWGATANWEIKWENVPEIRNPGYVNLPQSDFLTAADHVLIQANAAFKAIGRELFIKAYPDRVIVISTSNS